MWTLSVSHKQRRLIKLKVNELIYMHDPQGVWIDAVYQVDRQGLWLTKSQHLVGCTTTSGNVVHGQLYNVLGIEPAMLQILDNEETVSLTIPCNAKPTHCMCYYSAQGRTLRAACV